MIATIESAKQRFKIDLTKPIDLTIPVGRSSGPNAFYLTEAKYQTVEAGSFIGNVSRGGSCNCEDIYFNAHGDGTHTECAGHISGDFVSINKVLKQSLFPAQFITVSPENNCITAETIKKVYSGFSSEAFIIRSMPNNPDKRYKNYSGSNPPYFTADAIDYLNGLGMRHLLTDLPSLDREDDNQLLAHHAFFKIDDHWQLDRTATEMIYVPNEISDGTYIVEIQIAAFESDASPSRVRIYEIINEG
jgi:kynurenine formamidase